MCIYTTLLIYYLYYKTEKQTFMKVRLSQLLSLVQLFAIPWTVGCQALLSMGFPRQEYWSGVPFPTPGDLPNPGSEPVSLASPALAGRFFTTSATWEVIGGSYSYSK